jgi:hypothetical protein
MIWPSRHLVEGALGMEDLLLLYSIIPTICVMHMAGVIEMNQEMVFFSKSLSAWLESITSQGLMHRISLYFSKSTLNQLKFKQEL